MRTITLSPFPPSSPLLASAAKRKVLVVGKDDHRDFQTIHESNENVLCFVKYSNKKVGSMSQNSVKWNHLLADREADRLNFRAVSRIGDQTLHLIDKS